MLLFLTDKLTEHQKRKRHSPKTFFIFFAHLLDLGTSRTPKMTNRTPKKTNRTFQSVEAGAQHSFVFQFVVLIRIIYEKVCI